MLETGEKKGLDANTANEQIGGLFNDLGGWKKSGG